MSLLLNQWYCSIASQLNFGADCGVLGNVVSATSILRILPNTLSLKIDYKFSVVVRSLDGRSDTEYVNVIPSSEGRLALSIQNSLTRFNPRRRIIINGYISGTTAVTAEWKVLTPYGVSVPFTSLTPLSRQFLASDTSSTIIFPLSIDGDNFYGGRDYIFRLTAFPTADSGTMTYTEIDLTANSPPTGGYITSTPPAGDALVTRFSIASPGWTTEADNFPLSYAFSFTLSAASPYLSLAASSLRAFTISTLPAGLSTEGSLVTLQGEAMDILGSYSTATTTARVVFNTSTNVSQILTNQLKAAFSTGNVNLAFQTINNVSECFS